MKNPTSINVILPKVLENLGIRKGVEAHKSFIFWDKAVGKTIAKHSKPFSIKKGTLFVRVESSVWSNELSLLKKKIINKLNKMIGDESIKDIVFKI
jgi:predicted nucleic acid-binding Zn ribbon protein